LSISWEEVITSTTVLIRPERLADYNAIANLNYNSFAAKYPHYYKSEPLIASVLRHSQHFDPELSLVAELGGKVVGHALFSPFEFVVLGQKKPCVFLAPLAVDGRLHGQGIGSRLMEEGHRIARDKGYALSILCGIPEYYPRFGYLQQAFAVTGATIELSQPIAELPDISERPVMESDLPWIIERWQQVHGNDRLAWFPGESISQWFNHSLAYHSSVFISGGTRIAYAKYRQTAPLRVNELLTEPGHAEAVLTYLQREHSSQEQGSLAASMRADAIAAQLADSAHIKVTEYIRTSDALMLKVLDRQDEQIRRYCAEAKTSQRNLGVLAFPTLMDIDN